MDNTEAIKWLELLKQKNIEFDDYSEDTKEIREEATRRFQKSLSLGIQALENQKSIIEELEKIKAELLDKCPNTMSRLICYNLIAKHIEELKGESK